MTIDFLALQNLGNDLAKSAGQLAAQMQQEAVSNPETKSSATDPVTAGDKAAEETIVNGITDKRPDDGFKGEEGSTKSGTSGVVWHIDPIDGTTNYLYGLPFSVSIAASYNNQIVAGSVFAPTANKLFSAALGCGATCNGEPIYCRSPEALETALIAIGFSYQPAERQRQAQVLTGVLPMIRDIRRIGSAALDLCAVACGQVDGYYEEGLNLWDFAAGALIAKEAGAVVSDFKGEDPSEESLLAASPSIHGELLHLLQ